MLSYQHIYHAGNLADVHKHALLAWMLEYLAAKDKPLSYIETHAGRGLYRLDAPEAVKTGEAAAGIGRLADAFPADHPYARCLAEVRSRYGATAYPGSPLVAALTLRRTDSLHLFEMHPREEAELSHVMTPFGARVRKEDGFAGALSLCPPTPRRGFLLIDPSYEVKGDYAAIPRFVAAIRQKWNVGIVALWYPILATAPHRRMIEAILAADAQALRSEVAFGPAREGHRMVGSGMVVLNAPYGAAEEATRIEALFRTL
jgi:23S rRNA (adenine2030-N6)-methyltransferase